MRTHAPSRFRASPVASVRVQPFGQRNVRFVAWVCMTAIAVNAVLIQTVVTDPAAPLKNVVRASIFVLALVSVVLHRTLIPRPLVAMTVLSLVLLVGRDNPDQLSFMFVYALVPLLWSIPERTTYRILVFASLVSIFLIFLLLVVGVTQNTVIEIRHRSTFGTQGVPFFFNVVYGAATVPVVYCMKYRTRFRYGVLAMALAGTTVLFRATDARGGYGSFLIFVLMLALIPVLSRSYLIRRAIAGMPVIFLAVSFVIAGFADDPTVNSFLSDRPVLLSTFLENIGIKDVLLSTSVKRFGEVVHSVTNVDNSFLHLLVGGGIVATVFYAVAFMKAVSKLFEMERHVEVAFLVATCAYFNSESILLRIENVFVILSWYLVLKYSMRPESVDQIEVDVPSHE